MYWFRPPTGNSLALLAALLFGTTLSLADDRPRPGTSAIRLSDYQERYDRIVAELAAGRRPAEADALKTLLFDSISDPESGWYGPGHTRYDWVWLAARFDRNRDGKVVRKEFAGAERTWLNLDRDGDGAVTAQDMDWSPSSDWSRQEFRAWKLFLAMDGDGNGELTGDEWAQFFTRSAGDNNSVDIDAFRTLLDPSKRAGKARAAENPERRAKRLESVVSGDIATLAPGVEVGDEAPDFTLAPQSGGSPVRLADYRGVKPVVLTFGSYTCPPYRALFRGVERLHDVYGDRVAFLGIYVREAHPTDGLVNPTNNRIGIALQQPKTLEERRAVAGTFCSVVKPGFPVLVDEIDDRVARTYQGTPNRLYLIDRSGAVVYKSGQGPRGFKPDELGQSIELLLFDDSESSSSSPGDKAPVRSLSR